MDRRLTVLETRFDTILPTLATKADLAELGAEFASLRADYKSDFGNFRADIQNVIISTHRWLIGTIIVLLLGFGGMILTMANALKQMRQPIAQAAISQPFAATAPVRASK
ncbi:MAG TPA: hypothetical protein VFG03_15230 [Telluria sp.]|nr:hypothetical protein [Telluria sp.]